MWSYASNDPAKTGVQFSLEGSSSGLWKTESVTTNNTTLYEVKQGRGLAVGSYLSFEYALTRNITIGIKTGYFHVFDIGEIKTPENNTTISTDNIPLLISGKYHFNSKWFIGGEAGIDYQKLSSYSSNDNYHDKGNWNIAFMSGILGGYQWDNLSLSTSFDFTSGKNLTDDKFTKKSTLENIKIGLQLSYTIPI